MIYEGEVEADGCDWLVAMKNDKYYHPDSLPDAVKQDSLPVLVTYTKTRESFHCGLGLGVFPVIHVITINPR